MSPQAMLERLASRPGMLPPALLLGGPSQAQLEALAGHVASRLLCAGNDAEGRCESCRRARTGLHPDLLLVAPEGVQIRIDRVREAVAFAAARPYESVRKVVLVTQAELLGLEAGNALLKPLEEPGAHVYWILTSGRPEAILPTIRSRCVFFSVKPLSRSDRLASWRSRGFGEQDAADLVLLGASEEGPEIPSPGSTLPSLEEFRERRAALLSALEAGLCGRSLPSLLLLSDDLARADESGARLLAELLADAALAAAVSADLLRHRGVAGRLRELARSVPAEAFREAAWKATDRPPDSRRGNRRLHFEGLLLELYFSAN